jgi:hypothetical protein
MDGTNARRGPWFSILGAASALGFLFFSFGGLVFANSGCQASANGVCVARCDCQGCSLREREDCIDDVEDSQRLAEFDQCNDAYSAYVDCYANEGTCTEGTWVTTSCAAQGGTLRACSSRAARWVRSACQEAQDKYASCGLSGGGSSSCTGVDECVALCALTATCDDLANPQTGSPFTDCVLGCSNSSGSSGTGP